MKLLGCAVTPAHLRAWEQLLVFPQAPFFLRAPLPGRERLNLTRAEFRQLPQWSLSYFDAYQTYHVSPEATHVVLLTPGEWRGMAPGERAELFQAQWELGRGQVYDWAFIERVGLDPALFERDSLDTPAGRKVALLYDIWWQLTEAERERWLATWISEGERDCLSETLSASQWAELAEQHGPAPRLLAGTFAYTSGPNCLATALAATCRTPEAILSTAGLWLTQEPFQRALAERGYEARPAPADLRGCPPGAVVVWLREGIIQHACYALGAGLALNKNAQGWWAPRQVLPLEVIAANWSNEEPAMFLKA